MLRNNWRCSILVVVPPVVHEWYIPLFLLLWWRSDNFTTLYCPAEHVRSDAKFIIINSFLFYLVHILTWSWIIWNLQCLCGHCNGVICVATHFGRTNAHLSLTIEIVATVFLCIWSLSTLHAIHRAPGIHNETRYCGSASSHSRKKVKCQFNCCSI